MRAAGCYNAAATSALYLTGCVCPFLPLPACTCCRASHRLHAALRGAAALAAYHASGTSRHPAATLWRGFSSCFALRWTAPGVLPILLFLCRRNASMAAVRAGVAGGVSRQFRKKDIARQRRRAGMAACAGVQTYARMAWRAVAAAVCACTGAGGDASAAGLPFLHLPSCRRHLRSPAVTTTVLVDAALCCAGTTATRMASDGRRSGSWRHGGALTQTARLRAV